MLEVLGYGPKCEAASYKGVNFLVSRDLTDCKERDGKETQKLFETYLSSKGHDLSDKSAEFALTMEILARVLEISDLKSNYSNLGFVATKGPKYVEEAKIKPKIVDFNLNAEITKSFLDIDNLASFDIKKSNIAVPFTSKIREEKIQEQTLVAMANLVNGYRKRPNIFDAIKISCKACEEFEKSIEVEYKSDDFCTQKISGYIDKVRRNAQKLGKHFNEMSEKKCASI